ncbi:unnamed protein product [Candidula unifasciata]|uniref:Globin n=1 Tax=Candidula unifasciata TaxID=100452 RepID=A0A8S3ZWK9_9EUPU|nr:unnamed protein product [Candidula unifasciata]
MGGVISYLLSFFAPASQNDTSPDPTTGLTQKDRTLIIQTWSIIGNKDSVKENAVEFFIQLFPAYPYLLDYFPVFKGKPLSELRKSPKLRAHATSVFYTITSYVESVDDPETLVGLVQKIAESHVGRGITLREFENLKVVFLKFVKSQLGSKCTPQIESAWNKLLSAQNAVFQSTADEILGKK